MAMIKYVLLFAAAVIIINVLVLLFAGGINAFGIITGWFDSVKSRYPFIGDPLIAAAILAPLALGVIAMVLMLSGAGRK